MSNENTRQPMNTGCSREFTAVNTAAAAVKVSGTLKGEVREQFY